MAINRLLYSQQTCILSVGGRIQDVGSQANPPTSTGPYKWDNNISDVVKNSKNSGTHGLASNTPTAKNPNGFLQSRNFLLPVQSASVDETIPQEDILVMGNLGGVAREQKDVATSKCTIKSYLCDYLQWIDNGITRDAGVLSWEAMQYDNTANPPAWIGGGTDGGGQWAQRDYNDATSSNTAGVDLDTSGNTPALDAGTGVLDSSGLTGQEYDAGAVGPWPGITHKGFLAGEAWVENGYGALASQGLIEQLIWESMGGFECVVRLFAPSATNSTAATNTADGFTFLGILSSVSIDASKGGYPTMDLNFEGVGAVQFMAMSAFEQGTGADGTQNTADDLLDNVNNAGDWYVNSCTPHTSQDVIVWGRDIEYSGASGYTVPTAGKDDLTLIAGRSNNYYTHNDIIDGTGTAPTNVSNYGTAVGMTNHLHDDNRVGDALENVTELTGTQGNIDTINSAKMSFDMPTETLSALGQVIEGNTVTVKPGNTVFSKPPYKASLNLDGQGLKMAGHVNYVPVGGIIHVEEEILPNEIQVGQLHCVVDKDGAGVTSRSMNQNVGDVGASYTVAVEGTMASFRANYQDQARDIA